MTAQKVLQAVPALPAVSPAALQLIRLLGREDADATDVLRCLKHDPSLTARLLRLCNSAALGLPQEVVSVDQALFLLGYRTLHELAVQAALGDALSAALPPYAIEPRTLWRHSVVTARAAELLAEKCPNEAPPPDLAFTAALLHDIGKLVLAQVMDGPACAAIRHALEVEGRPWIEAERQALQTDHAEVGAALLERWELPRPIIHAVAAHHQPCRTCHPPLCELIHLADCLAHVVGADAGMHALAQCVDTGAAEHWQLQTRELEGLVAELAGHIAKVEASLEVP